MNFKKRKKSSRLAGGLAVVYLLTNTGGVYATEGSLWKDRRAALSQRRSDGFVLAQASLPLNNGLPSPLFPPIQSLAQNSPAEGGTPALSALPQEARKNLAWLPRLTAPYGEIRQIHLAGPDAPLVLHLQDAHDVEEAQRNMGGLVQSLLKEGHVRLIGLEGSTGPMSLDPFRQLPNKDITRGVLDLALRLGYIGGAELAAFDQPQSTLWGIESSKLYAGNLGAFERGEKFKRQDQLWVEHVSQAADAASKRWYGPALKEFEKHRSAYATGNESLTVWLPFLWLNRPLDVKYPQLSRLNGVLVKESALDFKAVERERQSLAEVLTRALPPSDLRLLLDQSLNQRVGRLSFADYHRFLQSLCARHSIKMKAYPHLEDYIDYVAGAEDVDPSGVMAELEDLEQRVEQRLASGIEEIKIAAARRDLDVLRKLVNHQLTPSEWSAYGSRRPDPALVAKTLAEFSGRTMPLVGLQGLRAYEDYSSIALKRNHALADNLLTKMRQEKILTAVLVAGGFHTEGLTHALKDSGVSYVVLGPRITKVPQNAQALEAIVRDPLPLEKLLAGDVIHLATPRLTGSLEGLSGEVPGAQNWAERGKHTIGSLQFAYQSVHAPGVENSSYEGLRRKGYLPENITQEVIQLPVKEEGVTAVVVRGIGPAGSSSFAVVESRDKRGLEGVGVTAKPRSVEKMTVDGQPVEFGLYQSSDVEPPSVLVKWARRGVSFLGEMKSMFATVLVQGRARTLRFLRGFATAWDNFLMSPFGRMLFPFLKPSFVVPLGTGGGLGSAVSGQQVGPGKLADIFPSEPTHWSSVQREDLTFVLAQMGEGPDSVKFLSNQSTNEDLVFALTAPASFGGQPSVITLRFTIDSERYPQGELYATHFSRGPPEVSLRSDVFRADNSSLKRHLSAVVQQALSTLPGAPFGQGNLADYRGAQNAVRQNQTRFPTWVEKHVPGLKNVSLFSRSMESIFNRTLAEKLQAKFGFDILRFLSQTNFTGGLGHVTYDYHASLGMDGADVASIFPLWNGIKGVVKHAVGERLMDGTPSLPLRSDGTPYESMGDMLRDTLSKREDLPLASYRLPESAAFWDWVMRGAAGAPSPFQWQCRKTLDLRGKDIIFDVYVVKDKYSGQPIFYPDAYVREGGNKKFVFDDLYGDPPDAPWRAVQVLVFSQASQQLIGELVRQGYAQSKIVTLDHEVFAQFPDLYLAWKGVSGKIRHGIHAFNHTVFRPGLWNLPKPVAGLLGLDQRLDLDEGGSLSIARAANERAGAVTGVSRIHFLVLLKNLFAQEKHKVVERFDPNQPDKGLSSTNGVLLEHWQGVEIRRLIDYTKEKIGLSFSTDDETFYKTLELGKNSGELLVFKKRFEIIKAFYSLDLLIFLNNTQTQPQGGGQWLAETLGEVGGGHVGSYTLENIREFRDQWYFLLNKSFSKEGVWSEIAEKFGDLTEALLKRPIASNVRRQVSYKGPDMYRNILETDKEAFRQSGVRLIFGGRMFDGGARNAFDYSKSLAQGVDNIAFLENYNSEDAPLIFRGAMAGVMLSNEKVEAAATSNSKIVVNGGWLISVHDGASPERTAILDKKTNTVKLAITYTHDDLRAGLANGTLEILNGSLIPFDDHSRSETDGKGAGRRPSRAGLLECFKALGSAYHSSDVRREMLYRGIRWSYTADIHRQTRAFLDIENTIVQRQEEVDSIAEKIVSAPSVGPDSLADQMETLFYKTSPAGFVWKHQHRVIEAAPLEGVRHEAGWVGFLAGFREVKRLYYDQGQGSSLGDEDGVGLWSLEHHVLDEKGNNELIDYVSGLLKDFPAFHPLLDQLADFKSDPEFGTNALSLNIRVAQTLEAIEFVQRTLDRVRDTVLRRDLEQGMALARAIPSTTMTPEFRGTLFQQDYSYNWRISVSPQSPSQDFNYLRSGPSMDNLRVSLKHLLMEGSEGSKAITQASYGNQRGGYFFSMMSNRWGDVPPLRNIVFALADEIETIKSDGGPDGWSNPAIQWEIRRVYAKFLGVMDELIEPAIPTEPQEHPSTKSPPVEENLLQKASNAISYENLGPLNRDLLGGSAHPLKFGSLVADVNQMRALVERERDEAKSAQTSLAQSLGHWNLVGLDGRLSETSVMDAGKALSRAVRRQSPSGTEESIAAAPSLVFMALVSFGQHLENATIEEWHHWASVFARGFNDHIFDAQERVLASIDRGRRLAIEISETLLNGKPTAEDKTRLEELNALAGQAGILERGKLTWILPEGTSSLDSLWSQYPHLAPLAKIPTQFLTKANYVREDGKYSVKNLLLDSQNQKQVESLDPTDLYLFNRGEWVLESDLPKDVARILISLAGGLIYDATEKVGEEMKALFFLRINA